MQSKYKMSYTSLIYEVKISSDKKYLSFIRHILQIIIYSWFRYMQLIITLCAVITWRTSSIYQGSIADVPVLLAGLQMLLLYAIN